MYQTFEVLHWISAVFWNSKCCVDFNNSPIYGLSPYTGEYCSELYNYENRIDRKAKPFQVINWPIIAKPLVYRIVREHISDHKVICELMIVSV